MPEQGTFPDHELEAALTLRAVEINVMVTKQDRRAFELYAQSQKRSEEMDIVVGVERGEDHREKTSD